jgi:hypothetical protein
VGKLSTEELLIKAMKDKFNDEFSIADKPDDASIGTTYSIKNITFILLYDAKTNITHVKNIDVTKVATFVHIMELCEFFEDCLDICQNINLIHVSASQINSVCKIRKYQPLNEDCTPTNTIFGHTFGNYRVTRINK